VLLHCDTPERWNGDVLCTNNDLSVLYNEHSAHIMFAAYLDQNRIAICHKYLLRNELSRAMKLPVDRAGFVAIMRAHHLLGSNYRTLPPKLRTHVDKFKNPEKLIPSASFALYCKP
jgi:hypothetical protein